MLPHPLDLAEVFHAGIHNAGQRAEGVQQPVGNGVGIPLGNGIEKHQFQDIHRVKVIQPLLQEPLFQALAMVLVIHFLLRHRTCSLPVLLCSSVFLLPLYHILPPVESSHFLLSSRESPAPESDIVTFSWTGGMMVGEQNRRTMHEELYHPGK